MTIFSIVLIAFGLSMDACAVSVSCGIACQDTKLKHAFKAAFFFGTFQAIMPLIGYYAGRAVYEYISHIDHWISFIMLTVIGGRMIYSALKGNEDDKTEFEKNPFSNKSILMLAVATSIDALAVGVSFALADADIFVSVAIIGGITFLLSFLSVLLGKKVGKMFQSKAEFTGGIILVLIGLKILLDSII